MAHLRLGVVEEFGIPVGLIARLARRRVEVVGAVEFGDPFVEVLHVMGVHEVHDDGQPQPVRPPDELLELLGGAEAGRGGEEAGDVVAERAVVGVLCDGHQLHGRITVGLDARQDGVGEFAVGAHTLPLLRHADVGFVDEQVAERRGVEPVTLPVERGGIPELGREVFGRLVLHHARGIGRDAVEPAVRAVDVQLVERAVGEPLAVHGVGEKGAPHPFGIFVQPQLSALPSVEIPEQIDVLRPR